MKMGPHGLCTVFATHMMQKGAEIAEISRCLGHANFSSTQIYTHITMKEATDNYNIAHPKA